MGAQSHEIFRLVLRDTLLMLSLGIAIGLPLALGTSRLIRGMLFEVERSIP